MGHQLNMIVQKSITDTVNGENAIDILKSVKICYCFSKKAEELSYVST